MREQLIQYVDRLFIGAPQAYDIKQEILQNTLDRYDDLISQGKSPEAAYSLAVAGIGDIQEILGNDASNPTVTYCNTPRSHSPSRRKHQILIWVTSIIIYLILSFATHSWYITWLIFPIAAAIQGLVTACMDLKEAKFYET